MNAMNPHTQFCPNPVCADYAQEGMGNISIHSRTEQRYRCRTCGRTFSYRHGTAFYRLRTDERIVTQVVTLLGYGCPPVAIVHAFEVDERTVLTWQSRAAHTAQQVHAHYVQHPRDLGEVQCDELRVKGQGSLFWMAMAIQVSTRLWLGGAVQVHRNKALIQQLLRQVKACASALCIGLLFATDGFSAYASAIRAIFRDPLPTGKRGRPPLVPWPRIFIAQVIKSYRKRRISGVERRIIQGCPEQVEQVRHKANGQGVINTAFIERLNGTFRSRIACLARRTRCAARTCEYLHESMMWVGTLYNFCCEHQSLRLPGVIGGRRWLARTPAMAAGLTDHCWSVHELLSMRLPPERPKQH